MSARKVDWSAAALRKALPPLRPRTPAGARPVIVELVGLAGAGKTTVLHAIRQRDESVRLWRRFERLQSLRVGIRHSLALAPTSLELLLKSPRSCWPCTKHLLRLRTFHTMLARATTAVHRAIILDEGPIYSMCRLKLFQKAHLKTARLPKGWRATLGQWPGHLDVVVWLDAPDPVLAERIRNRAKRHVVKRSTDRELFGFLERWRRTYGELLTQLPAADPVTVIEIDTTRESADQAADTVLSVVERMSPSRVPAGEP